jgi:hypothetical protein
VSAAIKGKYPVQAVQVDQRARGINAQTTRVKDPGIIAERAKELTLDAEGEHRVIATPVGTTCAADEEAHQIILTRMHGLTEHCFEERLPRRVERDRDRVGGEFKPVGLPARPMSLEPLHA